MTLPLAELSPREFEELCNALLSAEGFQTRHLGAAGGDRGWDIRAEDADGKLWCVQCKRVQSLDGSKAVRELLKVLDDPTTETPDVWCLMASRDISADVERTLNKGAKGRCTIQCVGKSDLEVRIDAQPAVRDRFFAANAPRSRIVYLSACKADRDVAAALRRDLQWNLRQLVGSDWNVLWHDPTDSALPEVPGTTAWGVVLVSPDALADASLMRFWHDGLSTGHDTGFRNLLALSIDDAVTENLGVPTWLHDRFDGLPLRLEPDPYRIDLSKIISKWIGTTEKPLNVTDVEGPGDGEPRLPAERHLELVRWLEPWMQRKLTRHYVATTLGLDLANSLDAFETSALQASAAIVLARGDDEPTAGALRLVDGLVGALDEEETAERLQELQGLADALRRDRPQDTVDRGLLPSWLHKVQQDHERLVDYFQQRQELDLLDQVYVELDMLPDVHAESRLGRRMDETKAMNLSRPRSLEDVLDLKPEEHSWITGRWVVRGDPGSGKTTLLRHLACRLARDPKRRWVPIFQSLPVLLRSRERLLDRIERLMLEETGREGLASVLEQEGHEGRLLILLDGLDEVGPEQRDQAEGLLRSLAGRWPRSPHRGVDAAHRLSAFFSGVPRAAVAAAGPATAPALPRGLVWTGRWYARGVEGGRSLGTVGSLRPRRAGGQSALFDVDGHVVGARASAGEKSFQAV